MVDMALIAEYQTRWGCRTRAKCLRKALIRHVIAPLSEALIYLIIIGMYAT